MFSKSLSKTALKNSNPNAAHNINTISTEGVLSVRPVINAKIEGIVAACRQMLVSQPSVSADILLNLVVIKTVIAVTIELTKL
jgi:hypothetical protein